MTLEEMLKEHPELKAEVDELKAEAKAEGEKEGADKERGRIENLDKIAANVPAEMLKMQSMGMLMRGLCERTCLSGYACAETGGGCIYA